MLLLFYITGQPTGELEHSFRCGREALGYPTHVGRRRYTHTPAHTCNVHPATLVSIVDKAQDCETQGQGFEPQRQQQTLTFTYLCMMLDIAQSPVL